MSHTHADSHESILVNRDEEHLRLLGVYHMVAAGFYTLLMLLLCIFPLIVGPAAFQVLHLPPNTSPQKLFLAMTPFALTIAVLALNGWSLKKHHHRISCIILSCFECLVIPVGLILGISAILVLRRDSVKELFQRKA